MPRVVMDTVFEPGDFVRLRVSPTGRVGVVSRVDPDSIASVQVYWHTGPGFRMTNVHEPRHLELVPSQDVPEYAVELKRSLEL
jgi:hypothetical protein